MRSFVVAKVLLINDQGQMLALQRSDDDVRRPGQWDFPGGHVDEGEDMMAAAIRETQEEAGISLDTVKLVFATTEMTPKHGSGTWLVFTARVTGNVSVTLSHEHKAYEWMVPQEFIKYCTYDRQVKMVSYAAENGLLA
jgi:8-oxo-dGTP pyrophosphatase MutT (NUDIX family)